MQNQGLKHRRLHLIPEEVPTKLPILVSSKWTLLFIAAPSRLNECKTGENVAPFHAQAPKAFNHYTERTN